MSLKRGLTAWRMKIARQGGGIRATVRATRAASEAQLYAESVPRDATFAPVKV